MVSQILTFSMGELHSSVLVGGERIGLEFNSHERKGRTPLPITCRGVRPLMKFMLRIDDHLHMIIM